MMAILYYLIPTTIIILFGIRKYRESKWGRCKNSIKLKGKVAIVTGANSGIGYEIAKDLAIREAEVIFACRDVSLAKKAIHQIEKSLTCQAVMIPMEVDLASLKSVRKFAAEIKLKYPKVDILINNAGVSFPVNTIKPETEEGYEIHFGVNHLGHFLLTNLLVNSLKNAHSSRVIVVSSLLHEKGNISIKDLNSLGTNCDGYANSKLANVYFARELAKRTENDGIKIYAVCPGWVYTNLFRHHIRKWFHNLLILPIAFFFMRSAEQGAQTPIYCATDTELGIESGFIYRDCQKYNSKIKFDDKLSEELWKASESLVATASEDFE